MTPEYKELLKANLIKLARDHRVTCVGEECRISLSLVLVVALEAGITFTNEELKNFA